MTVGCCDLEAVFSLPIDKYVCWGHQGHKQVSTQRRGQETKPPLFLLLKTRVHSTFISAEDLVSELHAVIISESICILLAALYEPSELHVCTRDIFLPGGWNSGYSLRTSISTWWSDARLPCITWRAGLLVSPHSWGASWWPPMCQKGPPSVHAYCLEDAQQMPLMRCCYDGPLLLTFATVPHLWPYSTVHF